MRTGFAKADITPRLEERVELGGYGFFLNRVPETILDKINASAFVIEGNNSEKAAIVSLDLVGLEDRAIRRIRGHVEEITQIAEKNIIVSCTHTHSGPASMKILGCGEYNEDYIDRVVVPGAIRSVMFANGNLKDSQIGFGRTYVSPRINENRIEGGRSNDRTLDLMKVDSRKPSAMVNFSCHPVVLPKGSNAISRDYPGALIDRMKEEDVRSVMFTNGSCGDINPSAVRIMHGNASYEDARAMGSKLAEYALETMRETQTESGDVNVASIDVELPFDRVLGFYKMMKEFKNYAGKRKNAPGYKGNNIASRILNEWASTLDLSGSRKVNITGIRIGKHVLLGLPGEIFSSTGLDIKDKYQNTTVLGYANGNAGYIPPKEEFAREGSYAIGAGQLIYNGKPFHADAEEILKNAALEVLKDLN